MRRNILLIMLLLCMFSCKRCKEEEPLSLCSQSQNYEGFELKTEGYYYLEYDNPLRRNILFLYKNGVVLYGGMTYQTELSGKEDAFMNGSYHQQIFNSESYWGLFHVSGSSIFYELWYPSSSQWIPAIREGVILNDTTFQIIKSYRCDGSENNAKSEIYHFKRFTPKVDSTNQFVP